MKIQKLLISTIAASALLLGCSETTHSNSWEDENNSDQSSMRESFKSSSSLSTRLDIDYNDTLDIGDTSIIYLEIAHLDTTIKKKDTTIQLVCGEEVLCLDTSSTGASMFLGEFPAGTRITISASTKDMEKDTIRIRGEFGNILKASKAIFDEKKDTEVFGNFMLPGHGSYASNQFVIFDEGFYYLDLNADFDDASRLNIWVEVDTSYYNYIGDKKEISMDLKDTIRGISIVGSAPKEISISFSSKTGYSIDFSAKGQWINKFSFYEKDSLIDASDSLIDQILLPNDSTTWTLKLSPLNIENYLSGPYSTFEAITNSRELGQGEYLAYPDSVVKPGETLTIVRERNAQAKYYLRQEQFVWLADMKKGDSIEIHQEMKGYFGGVNNKSYSIVDKKGKILGTISTLDNRFTATKDGPVYMHYLSTCPYLDNDNNDETLKFTTMISYFGSITSISFFDKTDQKVIDTTYIKSGETITLANFLFRTLPSTASSNMKWYTPCIDMVPHESENNYTTVPVFSIQNLECKDNDGNNILEGEQEISSTKLTAQENAEGESFRLIAESVADPTKRDTLTIIVQ